MSGINYPKTRAEAAVYPYAATGWTVSHPYDPSRCAVEVYTRFNGEWMNGRQCRRRNGHGPDGLYCAQHARKDGGE